MARPRNPARNFAGCHRRRLSYERLEDRSLLSLTHLYTFNDDSANDWIGNAHGTLLNGATVVNGQLVLSNTGVTSGQTGVVQHAKLPANVLSSGDATIEAWFTASSVAGGARVFDIGNQSGTTGNSYVYFTPHSPTGNSQGILRPSSSAERIADGPLTDDGVEHMAAVIIDTSAGLLRLFIDGTPSGSAPLNSANAGSVTDTLAYLGRSLFNVDPGFTGSINEVRIYDNAVPANEIAIHAEIGPSAATDSQLVRQMEYLNRGLIVMRTSTTNAYIGWRLLATDDPNIAFNLYRSANGGAPVKLNSTPITTTTNFSDTSATGLNLAVSNAYFVRPVVDGIEQAPSESFTLAANSPTRQYLNIPLTAPPGGTTPDNVAYTYEANDGSVGDVDGDGEYEIFLKWQPTNAKDNSQSGYTGNSYLDAYKLDGTRLWRIDMGRNIRSGAHYTQFLAYDFDGDGKAEVVVRTAEATVDGVGTVIGNPNADYRNSSGYILSGPEYLTVFNGQTGAIIDSIAMAPTRGSVSSWGDSYGNRVDRFQFSPAYLDGVHPSIVIGRGYAGPQSGFSARNEAAAFDYRNGHLSQRWVFQAATNGQNPGYVGQSAHSITVGDIDNDGKDEVITGASAINDDGTLLYNTGLGHGDALHMTDMDPTRPGQEVFMPHENTGSNGHVGASLRAAESGAVLEGLAVVQDSEGDWPDVGRGNAFDIDPNFPGYEFWDTYHPSIYDSQGNAIYAKPSNMFINFGAWWDADLLRELVDGTTISDFNYTTHGRVNYDLDPATGGTQSAPNASSNNGTKSTPTLVADIFGDWREEVIWRRTDNTALEIFSTIIPATSRIYTLMHDPQYREAIAWQNSGYNQPPHPSFFLGAGMSAPPTPNIFIAPQLAGDYSYDGHVDAADYVLWLKTLGSMTYLQADGNHDGIVNSDDEQVWRANFGTVALPGAGTSASLSDSSSSSSAAVSALSDATPANGLERSFSRLPISRLSKLGVRQDQKPDVRLVLAIRVASVRDCDSDVCRPAGTSDDGGSETAAPTLARVKDGDFLTFAKKFL